MATADVYYGKITIIITMIIIIIKVKNLVTLWDIGEKCYWRYRIKVS